MTAPALKKSTSTTGGGPLGIGKMFQISITSKSNKFDCLKPIYVTAFFVSLSTLPKSPRPVDNSVV